MSVASTTSQSGSFGGGKEGWQVGLMYRPSASTQRAVASRVLNISNRIFASDYHLFGDFFYQVFGIVLHEDGKS